jgi:hypothetical protein
MPEQLHPGKQNEKNNLVKPTSSTAWQKLCVSGQWSVVSGQWSVVSGQLSVVSGQLIHKKMQWTTDYQCSVQLTLTIFNWAFEP